MTMPAEDIKKAIAAGYDKMCIRDSILSQRNDECSELMEMYQFEPFEYSREEYVNNVIKGFQHSIFEIIIILF